MNQICPCSTRFRSFAPAIGQTGYASDRPIVEQLRQDGHSAIYIAEMSPGIDDEIILSQANATHALLLTLDKDFAN